MTQSFPAVLTRDGLRWLGDASPNVPEGEGVRVEVVVVDAEEPAEPTLPLPGPGMSGSRLVELMDRIADSGAFDAVTDPVAWERALREDRAAE